MLFKANKYILWLLLLVPITSICGLCSPIALNALTSFLIPGSFYDCDQMFSADPQFQVLPYNNGLILALENLYGYLILISVA